MDFTLVVVRPFGPHASGDAITDPKGVAAVLDSEHADKVVRVRADPVPHAAHEPHDTRPVETPPVETPSEKER
jgi:hypothetical protein